jgi:uncharacterized protein (TIGR02246 family)
MPFTGPAEDRLAIRDLLDSYADAVSRNDADDWAATWAEDGVWQMPEIPQMAETRGRATIKALWMAAMTNFPGIVFHAWPGSITIDGDRAEVRSWTSEVYDQGGVTKRDLGRYDDLCVKQDGKWLFARRTFHSVHRG